MADALAETGRTLDDLTATEAIELADTLRAVIALRSERVAADDSHSQTSGHVETRLID